MPPKKVDPPPMHLSFRGFKFKSALFHFLDPDQKQDFTKNHWKIDLDPDPYENVRIQGWAVLNTVREAAKKVNFLVVRPLRRWGGGVKGPTTKEKRTFFYILIYFSPKIVENFFLSKSVAGYFKTKTNKTKFLMTTKPRGVLSGRTTKKKNFFSAASLMYLTLRVIIIINQSVRH